MDIPDFLDELYGDKTGYVYSPVMESKRWLPHFFEWPLHRDNLITHLKDHSSRDVYISPVLFTAKRVSPRTFKGTNYIWTEFDGNAPESFQLEPTLRICSSKSGHEHWYWKLDKFTNNVVEIEDVTKRLAYALDADLSVWDYAVVLRPPETFNHKRQLTTKLIKTSIGVYTLDDFKFLPEPPATASINIDKTKLPSLLTLVAKYKWSNDAYELLTKTVDQLNIDEERVTPDRSAALTRLAFECVEMGMSNEEVFVVLLDADERWGKFKDRTDRDRRLEGLISYIRGKNAHTLEITDQSTIYRFLDFMTTDIRLRWVIPGVIPVAGSGLIFGPPGVGKSMWSLRMGMAVAAGREQFLHWPIEKQLRVGFVSLEMPHDELKEFFYDMKVPEEEARKLQENFFVWPIGHAYPFDIPDQQIEILKYIDQYEIKLLIVDSLGAALYGDISSDNEIKRLNSFLNEDLRKDRGCGYFFVHHPRKPGAAESKKPNDFYDAFGSVYIVANAQTVLNLNPMTGNKFKLNSFKNRLTRDANSVLLERTDNRDFKIVNKIEEEVKPSDLLQLGRKHVS